MPTPATVSFNETLRDNELMVQITCKTEQGEVTATVTSTVAWQLGTTLANMGMEASMVNAGKGAAHHA